MAGPVTWAATRNFIIRHRVSIQDLGILIAVLLVAGFLAFELDIYVTEGAASAQEKTIELDEALTLGGMLAVGLLIFSIRRYLEQKRETRRRIVAEQQVRTLAYEDALTGLPNRRKFDEALATAIASPPASGSSHALFLLDLNGFKQINDVYGHAAGDATLAVVAQRLQGAVRTNDLVSRFGGDEFAILAQHLVGPEAATSIALRVIQGLEAPIVTANATHQVGTGIGMALLPSDALTAGEALRKADVALYRAKSERRSAMRFFEEDMDRHVKERDELERELRLALARDEIRPAFQPTVDLRTGSVVMFEATPQWAHPTRGDVPAERFLPIAQEAGLIHALADRMLRLSCQAAAQWPDTIGLALEIFPGQLNDPGLVSEIALVLAETGLPASRLELAVAESMLVRELEAAQTILGGLREQGIRIALTNFGTGYSSLYHLRNFKLDKIKIDRGFVEQMRSKEESARIVSALVGLGHGLGITVSADGVGDAEQEAALIGTGCEQGRGRYFGRPLSAEATLALTSPTTGLADQANTPAPKPILSEPGR